MTTTQTSQLLSRTGTLTVERDQLTIPITIQDARSCYGRQEVLVVPQHGQGSAWISLERIELK